MNETPQILTTTYVSQPLNWDVKWGGLDGGILLGNARAARAAQFLNQFQQLEIESTKTIIMNTNRRIIQVFIADPDVNVPLNDALLYRGDQKLTDLTDQELFFEVPIADLLAKHNDKRANWLDKDASKKAGKDVLLEPARIRDLKMTVVNIAAF